MKSFFIDSNVLVYWLHAGSPKNSEVSAFLHTVFERGYNAYVLSSSLNEVYYALHAHYMDEATARACIATAADVFDLVNLTRPVITAALTSDEPDYEDGLVRAAAESLAVDAIVTYDRKAFKHAAVAKCTAEEGLQMLHDDCA